MLALDWSKTKPLYLFNGADSFTIAIDFADRESVASAMKQVVDVANENGKVILTENAPHRYKKTLTQAGIKVLTVDPYTCKTYADSTGIRLKPDYEEKNDEYDAKTIFEFYKVCPNAFKEFVIDEYKEGLRDAVANLEQIEKVRISIGNRQSSRGDDTKVEVLQNLEQQYKKEMQLYLETFPIYHGFFNQIKGCGTRISAFLLAYIDISKAHNPSALIKYCGLGVTDGKADRAKKGQTLGYNPTLKKTMFLLGESMIKQQTPKYIEEYELTKERLAKSEKYKDDSKGHIHNMAKRAMLELFLSDLHYHWRFLEGYPIVEPYAIAMLGHKHYIAPWSLQERVVIELS